jgi:hypothetical protein
LRRQHPLCRFDVDERISIEMRRDDIGPLIENAVKGIVVGNLEDRDGASPGAGIDVAAYALRLVTGNPRPERQPRLGQFGRPFRPRRRDNQKQHDCNPQTQLRF